MRKKLFSFVCCLAPIGAMAAVSPEYLNPTDGTGVITQTSPLTILQTANPKVVANWEDGGVTTRTHDLIIDNAGGINVFGLSAGETESFGAGFLYVPNNTDAGTESGFAISTTGPVSITTLLRVLANNSLVLGGYNTTNVKVTVGEVQNNGSLSLAKVTDFVSNGAVTNTGDLSINAGTVTVDGAGLTNSGTLNITSAGAMDMQGTGAQAGTITNDAGATSAKIKATSLTSGAIQNNSGSMEIDVTGGDLTVVNSGSIAGVVENKNGTEMEINAKNITVDGAMTNEGNDSTIKIIASGDLTINGKNTTVENGASKYNDASFVNGGNLYVDVAGKTTLANGFDVSTMGMGNTFEFATGTLDFGDDPNNWLRLFNNKLSKLVVNIRNNDIDTSGTSIINGAGGNTSANMTLTALNVMAGSIENSGANLYIGVVGEDDDLGPINGDITIANGIVANSGDTRIFATGTVTSSNGAVSAQQGAKLHISGEQGVTLNTVSNSGEMRIQSSNATPGNINITSNVTNNGTLNIESRDITISGVLKSEGGVTNIKGSYNGTSGGTNDSLSLAQVDVNAGVLNINALKGVVNMSGPLTVNGGAMNIGVATTRLDVTGQVNIAGDITLSQNAASSNGDVNIGGAGVQDFIMTSTGAMNVIGGIVATSIDANRTARFVANSIQVGDNGIAAGGGGNLKFADSINTSGDLTKNNGNLTTSGAITAATGASIEFYKDKVTAASLSGNGKFIAHGSVISATDGNINIANKVRFDGIDSADAGLVIKDTTDFILTTAEPDTNGGNIILNGIAIANGNTLHLKSGKDVELNGLIDNKGVLDVEATNDVTFSNNLSIGTTGELTVDSENIQMATLANSGQTTLTASGVNASNISATAGTLTVNSSDLSASALTVNGGKAILNVNDITVNGKTSVAGDLVQGNSTGALNLTAYAFDFIGRSMDITGNFGVENNFANYTMSGAFNVGEDINVSNGAAATVLAQSIKAQNLTNSGILAMNATDGIVLDNGNGVIDNRGNLTLSYADSVLNVGNFMSSGIATLNGGGLNTVRAFEQATLYQNASTGVLSAGDVNVIGSNFVITAPNVVVDAIVQKSGNMTLNTSDLIVKKSGIDATGLRVQATPATNWLNVGVVGDVSGNVQFVGLEHMAVSGNYTFNNNSIVNAAILPYGSGATNDSTSYNYWADISRLDDSTFGQITNRAGDDAAPLISVGGQFITNLDIDMHNPAFLEGNPATTDQVSIRIFDMIDQGTAIWLVHADQGVKELGDKIRNLNVLFCNADGSKCFNYFGSTETYNSTDEDLPAYLSVRDSAGDGKADSLYIVFDPRFGGPQAMFKIQPIVGRVTDHSKAEYVSAGALDDLIEGQLLKSQFTNRTPIDAIPTAFEGTSFETLANELYKRMEYYDVSRDGTGLARFSRLTEVREAEQLSGTVVLNEHTTFRDFEDRMLDEFIWHRNRKLRKAWGEFDFGLINQKTSEKVDVDATRFSFNGGYDWHKSQTLIFGLAGHISHTSGEGTDSMNLGYRPDEFIAGNVKTEVSDTNFGLGGYLLKTLSKKVRMYGNAFLDMHWLDVSRTQTFVDKIDGNGTAFSLISEWGLMHDWLNQYVVGNLYLRGGYNTGFSINEKSGGSDYVKLESDGYFILTPGYSLIAQKRFYPSTWFQIRPYVSVGVEYDVAGAPDTMKYKFAPASRYTKYSVDIDPLWANIGGGMEFVSAMGIQFGLDYRYQYNADIQMHKIKLSGSYRF